MNTKCLFFSFALLITCFGNSFGQKEVRNQNPTTQEDKKKHSEEEKEKQLRREREIQNLVLTATAQPIEIAADILFRALDAKLIKDTKKQREIVEDIFRRASEAKEPFKKAFRKGNLDTRAGYLGYAYGQDLDNLSIQLRAIKRMLALDKQKARSLFRELPDIKLKPLTCEDDLDYEVSQFYKILIDIVDKTFDSEARQRSEHIYFVASYIDSIDSPAQVRPVIDLLSTVKTTPQEFEILLDSFIRVFRKLAIDPRSFAFSIIHSRSSNEIKFTLLPKIEAKGLQPAEFLRSYRQYLVKQFSTLQCGDSQMTGTGEKPDSNIEFANTLFKNPITDDEIKPEKIEPRAKKFEYWHTTKSAKLLTNIKKLRFGSTKTELALAERSTQEWHQSLMEFLQQMKEWKPEDEETEADYFHQRNVLYDGLVQMAPESLRSLVLMDYALFLRDSRIQKENPIEWLYYVKRLLAMGKTLNGKEYEAFMNELSRSGNQIFQLYIDLARLQSPASP